MKGDYDKCIDCGDTRFDSAVLETVDGKERECCGTCGRGMDPYGPEDVFGNE